MLLHQLLGWSLQLTLSTFTPVLSALLFCYLVTNFLTGLTFSAFFLSCIFTNVTDFKICCLSVFWDDNNNNGVLVPGTRDHLILDIAYRFYRLDIAIKQQALFLN